MDAKSEELARLLALQQIDLDILRCQKQFDDLPQRNQILTLREKRASVQAKLSQVEALKKDAAKRLSRINDEDASLIKKEAGVQAAMNAARGDFRNVTARTKELEGIARRRKTIGETRDEVTKELSKIGALQVQVMDAIHELDVAEKAQIESFKEQGGALKSNIAALEAEREKVLGEISPQIQDLYKKTANRCSGVAVGMLRDNQCGVCRAVISGGHLIDLRAQAPLGVCPNCRRLLIIE